MRRGGGRVPGRGVPTVLDTLLLSLLLLSRILLLSILQVSVLLPREPHLYGRFLEELWVLDLPLIAKEVTAEDQQRTEMYRGTLARNKTRAAFSVRVCCVRAHYLRCTHTHAHNTPTDLFRLHGLVKPVDGVRFDDRRHHRARGPGVVYVHTILDFSTHTHVHHT
jgi:hypothetical protein